VLRSIEVKRQSGRFERRREVLKAVGVTLKRQPDEKFLKKIFYIYENQLKLSGSLKMLCYRGVIYNYSVFIFPNPLVSRYLNHEH